MNALSIPNVADPIALFDAWLKEATGSEPDVPDAMSLATVGPGNRPSLRMVLLKGFTDGGFVFYTNAESRKGEEIAANPFAALCFHWKSLGRQVRIEGVLTKVSDADSDAYWNSRPRGSQIAAWASDQSRVLDARATLQARVAEGEKRFAGKPVPRPPHWLGYSLAPEAIEFWQNVPNRLHERLVFRRAGGAWQAERLYP
jgi:pyridoxamine 5'-phosphate oxidase